MGPDPPDITLHARLLTRPGEAIDQTLDLLEAVEDAAGKLLVEQQELEHIDGVERGVVSLQIGLVGRDRLEHRHPGVKPGLPVSSGESGVANGEEATGHLGASRRRPSSMNR